MQRKEGQKQLGFIIRSQPAFAFPVAMLPGSSAPGRVTATHFPDASDYFLKSGRKGSMLRMLLFCLGLLSTKLWRTDGLRRDAGSTHLYMQAVRNLSGSRTSQPFTNRTQKPM